MSDQRAATAYPSLEEILKSFRVPEVQKAGSLLGIILRGRKDEKIKAIVNHMNCQEQGDYREGFKKIRDVLVQMPESRKGWVAPLSLLPAMEGLPPAWGQGQGEHTPPATAASQAAPVGASCVRNQGRGRTTRLVGNSNQGCDEEVTGCFRELPAIQYVSAGCKCSGMAPAAAMPPPASRAPKQPVIKPKANDGKTECICSDKSNRKNASQQMGPMTNERNVQIGQKRTRDEPPRMDLKFLRGMGGQKRVPDPMDVGKRMLEAGNIPEAGSLNQMGGPPWMEPMNNLQGGAGIMNMQPMRMPASFPNQQQPPMQNIRDGAHGRMSQSELLSAFQEQGRAQANELERLRKDAFEKASALEALQQDRAAERKESMQLQETLANYETKIQNLEQELKQKGEFMQQLEQDVEQQRPSLTGIGSMEDGGYGSKNKSSSANLIEQRTKQMSASGLVTCYVDVASQQQHNSSVYGQGYKQPIKLGYQEGQGLRKNLQGIAQPVSVEFQRDRKGLSYVKQAAAATGNHEQNVEGGSWNRSAQACQKRRRRRRQMEKRLNLQIGALTNFQGEDLDKGDAHILQLLNNPHFQTLNNQHSNGFRQKKNYKEIAMHTNGFHQNNNFNHIARTTGFQQQQQQYQHANSFGILQTPPTVHSNQFQSNTFQRNNNGFNTCDVAAASSQQQFVQKNKQFQMQNQSLQGSVFGGNQFKQVFIGGGKNSLGMTLPPPIAINGVPVEEGV